MEWRHATTDFCEKGHEELQLIMRTVLAKFTEETTFLIKEIEGKIDEQEQIIDDPSKTEFYKIY